jgi:hypothetical protein
MCPTRVGVNRSELYMPFPLTAVVEVKTGVAEQVGSSGPNRSNVMLPVGANPASLAES